MDKLTPQQLKLEFDSVSTSATPTILAESNRGVAVTYQTTASIVNFNDVLLQRSKAKEKLLYLQILESVRNIG